MGFNLNQSLLNSVSKFPDRVAYAFLNESVSYFQLNQHVDLFAASLIEHGIEKGDKVAMLLSNSPEFVTAFFGILRVGAVVVPINPTFTEAEISFILSNSGAKAAIALSALKPILSKLKTNLEHLQSVIYTDAGSSKWEWDTDSQRKEGTISNPIIEKDELAVILYTSGTTGRPKGAMLSHANLVSNANSITKLIELTEEDSMIAVLPMFHTFCMSINIIAPISAGAAVIIVPKFSPVDVIQTIHQHKATIFTGVPTMYNFLINLPDANSEHLSSVRLCLSGGASIPVELLNRFEDKYKVAIMEGYGLSETSPVVTFNPLTKRKPGSVGVDIPDVKTKIVDEHGKEIPIGEVGEIIAQGPNIMMGYLGLPEATAEAIKDGWFYTGDLGRMDDEGYVYIVDRKKDLIIVGGFNVYPREVEEVLYQHPGILEAAVIGVPSDEYGEIVKAFVVAKHDAELTENDIHVFCYERLAKYKRPKEVEFRSELPKNSTGKILRRELRTVTKI